MLRYVAAFELRYQLKSPVFWIGCLLFFLFAFGAVTSDTIQLGARGNVNVNSPYALLQTVGILNIFTVFVIVSMVAGVVLRDDETGFAPIVRSTSVSKFSYLVGRFSGASAAALLVVACVPLAVAIGSVMPWLDSEKVGPLRLGDYAYALFAFALPTLLIVSAAFFALATATRSMMWTYVGAVALLVLYFVSLGALRDQRFDAVSNLLDPFGLTPLRLATKYWTATERNSRMPPLAGPMLMNRLLWTGLALALFAFAYRSFRFDAAAPGAGKRDRQPGTTHAVGSRVRTVPLRTGALPLPRHDAATGRAQLWRLARFDMAFVFRSPAFFVLLAIGVVNAGASLWFSGEWYGSGSYPVTRLMVDALNGAFTLMPIIIAIFYGGELVWRDRERRVHEIVDATAAPDWAHLLPKIVAITLVLASTMLVAIATGMLVQAIKGYFRFELGAYLLWFALPTVILAVQLAVLSVFVQVLVAQKFIGWGVMLVYIVASTAMSGAGFEHHLYDYAGSSPVPLSDMNGLGRFWIGRAWFQVYWSAFALVLAVLAHGLWRRGVATALSPRLRQLPRHLDGGARALLVGGLAVWITSGAFIFHNTNGLNRYQTAPQRDEALAAYEKQFLLYERVPQPTVAAVTLDVQLYPREVRAVTRGSYLLINRTSAPIDTLHIALPERLRLDALHFAGATLQHDFAPQPYRIYALQPALKPGESRLLDFTTTLQQRGFPNNRPLTRIVDNGTFLDNSEITPSIGVSRVGLLRDRAKRRKYGLPADLRPPTLEDESGRAHNPLRHDSDWVDADITVTTDADQTPIAPGQTLSDTTANGRRTVHVRPDAPINHFFSIQSARYAVQTDSVVLDSPAGKRPVQLAVYHQPGHAYNVPAMLATMKDSLTLFNARFSPYQFKQARILEFPAYADFAQSFANTIPYSENLGFITHLTDPSKIDVVRYVTAHEIAHQWWGHQLLPSEQQGATMLIESFAQYSALLVMEQSMGRDQMRRFLKYELDRYLRSRGGEVVEELPLARVEDQPYIHYQKGSVAMYWLREVVGEAAVDRAMSRLIADHAFKAAPYPNTTDFLRLLRAEAGSAHDALITDLFEKITLLDLKTTAATAVRRADGRYDVALEVEAHKLYADGKGRETEAPLDESVDIGVFTGKPGDADFTAGSVLRMERRTIRSGKQTVRLVVDKLPTQAGIDPYNKRIDRNTDDNIVSVDVR